MKFRIITVLLAAIGLLVYSCQSEEQIEYMRYYSAGQALYKTKCQNCHGEQGQGLAALIPPLTDSVYLKANHAKLACYIQNGLNVPILVNGKAYNGQMPATGLAPMEIAQVLTYVRNSFGNKLGLHNVKQVECELKDCD
jgi:mono/diheme cytochrome c family protein